MDKVKQAIAKELANECYKNSSCFDEKGKQVNCLKDCAYVKNLSSSLTSLIIKWLEGKKRNKLKWKEYTDIPVGLLEFSAGSFIDGRNQLITELIGEVR